MKDRIPYSYTVLRYIHDLSTGEFVNLGVVLSAPEKSFFAAKMRRRYARVTQFFPDARGSALTRTLRILEKEINESGSRHQARSISDLFSAVSSDALDIAQRYIPRDDSSLQWSPSLGGFTANPGATLERLFDRLVSRYDEEQCKVSRTDQEVWQPFSRALEIRRLDQHLTEHDIVSPIDTVRFEHAMKNGKWHLLEPVSFDLMDGASIKKKANQIVGQMAVLEESKEPFDIYLLVGEPKSLEVLDEYDVALKTLGKIGVKHRVFTESNVDEFGQVMEIAMAHQLSDGKEGKEGLVRQS